MNAEDEAGLRYLRVRLEAALMTAEHAWARNQLADCIASIDTLLGSPAPPPAELLRLRARAKSVLAITHKT